MHAGRPAGRPDLSSGFLHLRGSWPVELGAAWAAAGSCWLAAGSVAAAASPSPRFLSLRDPHVSDFDRRRLRGMGPTVATSSDEGVLCGGAIILVAESLIIPNPPAGEVSLLLG